MIDGRQRQHPQRGTWSMVSKTPSRFSYDAPGPLRMIWHILRHRDDWRSRCNAVITDHRGGERFQLDDEEEGLMGILADHVNEIGAHTRLVADED